jgi:predicted phage terminase large subunit-like protein
LVGRVLEKSYDTKEIWTIINFPAIADQDEEYRQKGEVLWPDKKSFEELMIIKQNNLYDWNALYQQNPIAAETQDFKQEWFKYSTDEELKQKDLYYYTVVDLASDGPDRTAIITIAKSKNSPEIYIEDVHAGHFDPGETVDYLFFLKNTYGHRLIRVGIEDVAYQRTLQYWIREEQKKREVYFDVTSLKAKGNKELRIRGLIPMYRAGILYHKKGMLDLEEELLVFPKGKHDDIIDALAYAQQILEQTNYRKQQSHVPNWKGGYLGR